MRVHFGFHLASFSSKVSYQAKLLCDSVDAAYQLAIAGAGLSSPPDFLVERDLKEGKLIEVLPEWHMEPLTVYAIWPQNLLKNNLASRFRHALTNFSSQASLSP